MRYARKGCYNLDKPEDSYMQAQVNFKISPTLFLQLEKGGNKHNQDKWMKHDVKCTCFDAQ